MTVNDDGWLARWSRRKLAARHAGERPQDADAARAGASAEPSDEGQASPAAEREAATVSEADVDSLDALSDYTPFLRPGVRTEVRTAALRKLWSSEPIFSYVDGLQDYAGDFTDSAAVPSEPIATAYEVGCGIAAAGQPPVQEDGRDAAEPEQPGGTSETDKKPAGNAERPQSPGAPPAEGGRS